jgi:2-amino-4-hydroxy-6-hydroxymethyldihydropteridine diphosphokinase
MNANPLHRVYLGLGSNLGNRLDNLRAAVEALQVPHEPAVVHVTCCSSIYETEPWGYLDQPAFYNQAVEIETDLAPLDLLAHLKQIEQILGREQTFLYGPRLIDLDILLFDDLVIDLPGLKVPHSFMAERNFVLVPLAEMAPNLIHPVSGQSILELKRHGNNSGVKLVQK